MAVSASVAAIQVGVEQALEPSTQAVELSDVDRALLRGMQSKVQNDPGVIEATRRFFKAIERDPAITNVEIADPTAGKTIARIPKSQFPGRSGLWEPEALPPPEEVRTDVWDVVLIKAPFVHAPRSWTFSRDGLPFSARMEDPVFLGAIATGTVPITLQEGVVMRIEVQYRERLVGQVWEYVDRSRKVTAVITPRPLPAAPSLPLTRPPK